MHVHVCIIHSISSIEMQPSGPRYLTLLLFLHSTFGIESTIQCKVLASRLEGSYLCIVLPAGRGESNYDVAFSRSCWPHVGCTQHLRAMDVNILVFFVRYMHGVSYIIFKTYRTTELTDGVCIAWIAHEFRLQVLRKLGCNEAACEHRCRTVAPLQWPGGRRSRRSVVSFPKAGSWTVGSLTTQVGTI